MADLLLIDEKLLDMSKQINIRIGFMILSWRAPINYSFWMFICHYDNNSFESLDNFRQILGEISAIIQDSNTNEVIVMGDFNADFNCRFWEELMYFAADNTIQISDGILCGYRSDCLTYISVAHGTVTWLDHVVCTGTAHRHVLSCDTLDDITFGDHIPVQIVY